ESSSVTLDPKGLADRALAAFQERDRDGAAHYLEALVASGADIGKSWGAISRLASTIGEVNTALTAARRYAEAVADNPYPRLEYGQMLAQHGRGLEAREQGDRLVRTYPRDPAAWHFLGTCRAQLGETEAAISDLRRSIALMPDPVASASSWQSIAESKTFAPGDPDLHTLQGLLGRMPANPKTDEAKSVLLYSVGKALDDIGDTREAFDAYAAGAGIMRRLRPYNPDENDAFVDSVIDGWTRAFAAALPRSTVDSARPIFVFGLPRSGTTLIEQILASHPDVADGAELSFFTTAAMPIRGFTPDTVKVFADRESGAALDAIGRAYLRMIDQRFGGDGRIVDKTLNHSRFLGLIHHILPNARFIWLKRSPGAVAWSCYRTRFSRGID
ncbi:MAG: hypothetical protein EON96_18355, partial [Caulobacteraceae bacterium]